jgi:hypothetical protein
MQILTTSILVGSLLFIGALPEAFAQPVLSHEPERSSGDHDSYLQQSRNEMHEWHLRLEHLGEKAKAAGKKDVRAAERELDAAWVATEADASRLRAAGAEGWDNARIAYEKSTKALTVAWDKVRPEDK